MSVGLDDHTETLSSIGSPDSAEDDVAELFLCPQLVVTVLVDDLTEELQQHVVPRVLKTTLVVVLYTAAPVDTIGGGEDAAPVTKLHLPLLHQLGGKQWPGFTVSFEAVQHSVIELESLAWTGVTVHQTLHVNTGQQPRDEVCQ